MEAAGDRVALGKFIVERFHERYFRPTTSVEMPHGFTLMAIACLVIEARECFHRGKKDSKGESGTIFESFFKRPTGLEAFGGRKNWFYNQILRHPPPSRDGRRLARTARRAAA
jgi:hypothetical protein